MDPVVGGLLVTVVLAAVVVFGIMRARGRFRGEIHGPGGTRASVEGGAPKGLRLRGIKAGRNVVARGSAIDGARIKGGRDVTFDDGTVAERGDDDRKA